MFVPALLTQRLHSGEARLADSVAPTSSEIDHIALEGKYGQEVLTYTVFYLDSRGYDEVAKRVRCLRCHQ